MSGEHKLNFVPLIVGTVVGVTIIITLAVIVGNGTKRPVNAEEVNTRIQPVAAVALAAAGAAAGNRTGEALYQEACLSCHDTGAAGAPKLGDAGAWASRIALGLDGLLKSAIAGKNAMPPRGGSDATDEELARAIAYMANKSGAKFAEPK